MLNNFWKNIFSSFFVIIIPSIGAVLSILLMFSKKLETLFGTLGILFAILIIAVCFIITLAYNINKILIKAKQTIACQTENVLATKEAQQAVDTVNHIFRSVAAAIKFSQKAPKISIHYFYYLKKDTTEFLVKDRRYCIEEVARTVDYSLDKCRLDAKNIVMCEAFRKNRIIFENLPPNHTENYEADIKEYIDSDIRWVLACPVWKGGDTRYRLGVVVVFGTSHIVDDTDKTKIRALENIGLNLSTSISNPIEIASTINCGEYLV